MAAQTAKQQVADLVKRLHEAADREDNAAKAAIQLVKLMSDELKESLVNAVGEDMLRVQGAARAFKKLHGDLIAKPLNLQEPSA